ncbi:MAG: N-acetylmuramoyl-L-alanine amidase [Xanthomonadales bacterium]|nr:N-acetylmuramoyl-L-alanine amidase [Xanthomonadales bacterium]
MSERIQLVTMDDWPLPYVEGLQTRPLDAIDLIVMHCTELPDLTMAREYGERVLYPSGTGNSGHYYIDRNGSTHCFVAPERIAHHTQDFNQRAIGIELVNRGRYPTWLDSRHQDMTQAYPQEQIEALLGLLQHLREQLPQLRYIAGHEDLDRRRVPASDDGNKTVRRKRDPGPLFPWQRVLHASGLKRLGEHDQPIHQPAPRR